MSSNVVDFFHDKTQKGVSDYSPDNNFNNLFDVYLSEGEAIESGTEVSNKSSSEGKKMADILLRALIFGVAKVEDKLDVEEQQKIKDIIGELSQDEIDFASQKLQGISKSTATPELPAMIPTMEEIEAFLAESELSKVS